MSIVPYTMKSNIQNNELYLMSLVVATLLSSFICIVKKYNNIHDEEDVLPVIEYREIECQTHDDIDAQVAAMNRQELQDENDLLNMLLSEQTAISTPRIFNIENNALDFVIIDSLKSNPNGLSVKDILKILSNQYKELDKHTINSRLYTMIKNKKTKIYTYKEKMPIWKAI